MRTQNRSHFTRNDKANRGPLEQATLPSHHPAFKRINTDFLQSNYANTIGSQPQQIAAALHDSTGISYSTPAVLNYHM